MSKSSAGVCFNVDSNLNSSSREDDQDIFTRNSEPTNDKKRPATRLIGGNANEDLKIKRKNVDGFMNDAIVSTSTSAITEISTENNVASGNDLDSRRTKTSDGVEVDAAAEGIVDMEFPNVDANCSSALSSACSSPIHRSPMSDQWAEKESGNESASGASGSSAASSASCSSSSYQYPPPPPTTPITGYKPYVEAQVKDNRAFYNVATPKPSASDFPPLPTDGEMIAPAGPGSRSTASITEAEPKSPAQEDSAENKSDDFDSWKVGKRYELIRILGRGSYGEVAQAKDLHQPRPDGNSPKYVAIKRISTAYQQDVDALRFFREIHLLRRLREHDCIIQLIDVVEPESNQELDDIYLIFECKSVSFANANNCCLHDSTFVRMIRLN